MSIKRLVCAAAFTAIGCHASASASEIVVAAASSLTNAFAELAVQFQHEHPETKVLMSFAGSDTLAQQVIQGAPMDIFASADQVAMDTAAKAGGIDTATRQDFVRNDVVLIVTASNPLSIKSLADLASASVKRIALGNPATVPAGRYTKAALEHAGSWDTVKRNEVLGQNVRQVLDYVARGEVDAGFVFATDAAIMPDKVAIIEKLASPSPALYPIALVDRPNRHPAAQEFLSFVLSPKGADVLAKHGFLQP